MDNIETLNSNRNTPFMDDLEDSPLISRDRRRQDGRKNNANETFTDFGETEKSYHSALIFMVFLATIGIVLVLATIPVNHLLSTAPGHAVVKIIRIMYYLFASCLYIWFLRNRKNLEKKEIVCWSRSNKVHSNSSVRSTLKIQSQVKMQNPSNTSTQKVETHCSLTGAIIVLGCGGTILNFTCMISGIYCLAYMDRKPTLSEAINPVCYASYCFIVVLQMVFFKAYDGVRFAQRSILHYTLAVWIAADWWQWFALTATPLVSTTVKDNNNETYMCPTNLTAMFRFTGVLTTYLRPMSIEYATVSISVLFQLWGTMTNADVNRLKSKRSFHTGIHIQDASSPAGSEITDKHVGSPRPQLTFKGIFKKYTCVIVGTSVLGLINLILQIEISEQYGITNSLGKHDDKKDTTIRSVMIWFLTLFLLLPTTLLLIPCTRPLKHPILGKYSLGVNDCLLLFTSAFIFIYDLLRLGAVAGLMQLNTERAYLMALFGLAISTGYMLQTYMQTKFLITVQRNKAADEHSNERISSFLLHLSVTNAFYWFIICFSHESHMDIFAPIMTEFFGSDEVGKRRMQVIGMICVPFISLYRFHSAVLAYELVKSRPQP